jgi:hypothetical protein
MRKAWALLALVVAAALIAGCGSSSSSTTTSGAAASTSATSPTSSTSATTSTTAATATATGAQLSETAWKAKINSICAGVTAQGVKIARPTSLTGIQNYLQQIVNVGNSEIAQIKAVNPPAKFAAGQQAVVADLTTIYGKLQDVLNKHLSGAALAAAFKAYPAQIQSAATDYVTRSKAAGLTSCVVGATP